MQGYSNGGLDMDGLAASTTSTKWKPPTYPAAVVISFDPTSSNVSIPNVQISQLSTTSIKTEQIRFSNCHLIHR